ncbi:MAG: hypothetical protein U9P80_10155 [Thermodesulfobacteriota bacterium]|nr:hypothetical protein [Thermodesulfobacteriota bacterium]
MTTTEYREKTVEKWDDVRPVVIYFAGERFLVEYDEAYHHTLTPIVALVHSYLGNMNLIRNDN